MNNDWARQLLLLQEKDLRLSKIEEQQRAVPKEKAAASGETKDDEDLVHTAKTKVREAELVIKGIEIEIETIRAKVRDFQTKSGMIKNNEEYKAAMLQVESCQKQIRQAEDRELKGMDELEQAKKLHEAMEKKLAATRQRVNQKLADLETRERNCEQELARMRQERTELVTGGIPIEVLRRYDRLRAQTRADRRALVPIREGVCDGCHMNITAQTRVNVSKGQPAPCQNCGRLLYIED